MDRKLLTQCKKVLCENETVVLVVKDGPSGTSMELSPSNRTVLRGSSLSINCSTDANPMAHVFQFYLDDIYIGNSSSGVYNVTVTADGAYTCVPVNTVGKEQNATVVISTVGMWNPHSLYIIWCNKIDLVIIFLNYSSNFNEAQ